MKSKPPSKLDNLYDGCTGCTTSFLPDGSTQSVAYKIESGVYGLKPIKVQR